MSLALYRKYRPSIFKEVVGQEHVKITLENELRTDKIAHAYLFNGPRGTGKTTMARILAKAVNCENRKNGESEPCNKCASCKAINEGKSLDVIEIDGASNRGVENIQNNILNYIRLRPNNSKYKVFIIDEVHMLTAYAFNALLKTLEEPPEYVIFILATTEVHKILPTIISRCQHFDFSKIDGRTIKERLMKLSAGEGIKVDEKVLDLVVHYSDGCMRDAESLLSQLLTLDDKELHLDQAYLVLPRSNFEDSFQLLKYILSNELNNALLLLNELLYQGVDIDNFYKDFISLLREFLLVKINISKISDLSLEKIKEIEKLLEFVSVSDLISIINIFISLSKNSSNSVIPQLPLELAIISSVNKLFSDKNLNNNFINDKKKKLETGKDNKVVKEQVEKKTNFENLEKNIDKSIISKLNEGEYLSSVDTIENNINNNGSSVIFDIKKLQGVWGNIRTIVKKYNISLASALAVSVPVLENNKLYIKFKYEFNYKKVISNPDFKEYLDKSIEELLGHSCEFDFTFDPSVDLSLLNGENKLIEENNTQNNDDALNILGVELSV